MNKTVFLSLCLIFALYLLSCIAHRFSVYWFLPVFQMLSCLLFYMLITSFNEKERGHILTGVVIGGIIVACLGLLSYAANLPIPAAVSNARLQGTLQYANATAILLVIALFTLKGLKGKILAFRPLMLLALLLTLSFGGMLAYCLGIVLYIIKQKRGERTKIIFNEIADFSFVALFAAGIFYSQNVMGSPLISILLLTVFCCLCGVWKRFMDILIRKTALRMVFIGLLLAEGAGVLLLRGTEALGNFGNRMVQITDGLTALLANPIFGIGPSAWAIQKDLWQKVFDRATIIHSSYVQIAVDAGIFALILAVVIAIVVLKRLYKTDKPWNFAAAASLAFHGLIDLSFYFTGIVFCGIAVSVQEEKCGFALPKWAIRLIAGGAVMSFLAINIIYF